MLYIFNYFYWKIVSLVIINLRQKIRLDLNSTTSPFALLERLMRRRFMMCKLNLIQNMIAHIFGHFLFLP